MICKQSETKSEDNGDLGAHRNGKLRHFTLHLLLFLVEILLLWFFQEKKYSEKCFENQEQ